MLGVHPAEGHDIPGVRSLRQLKQTALFFPREYDGLVEVTNEEAYELCRRINQEDSIIAGPSSGLALAGALKLVPDEPGVVCVVVFPDNAFKYASSLRKHLPELFAGAKPEGTGASGHLANIVELARSSDDVVDPAQATALLDADAPSTLLDVRLPEEYAAGHAPGAKNVPLPDLAGGWATGLPEAKDEPIVTICKVGERSLYGMLLLKAMGYHRVKSVRGGLQAWTAAGLPTLVEG